MADKKPARSKNTKKPAEKKGVIFKTDGATDGNNGQFTSPFSVVEEMRKNYTDDQKTRVEKQKRELMTKAVKPVTIKKNYSSKVDRSKTIFTSRALMTNFDNVEEKHWRRILDSELRELAQLDPYISAIISTRCSQASVIGRPSDSKFDKGTRVMELDPLNQDDFETMEEFYKASEARQKQMAYILDWIMNCGTTNKEILDYAFKDSDKDFKHCALHEFISAQVRNLLTFGRAATQTFRGENDAIDFFRPAPVETIRNVVDGEDIGEMSIGDDTAEQSQSDSSEYNKLKPEERPIAYVQKYDGQNINFFTEDDLKMWFFQKQALMDLSGYPLAPIEQAIYMVFTHQQTLNYLRNHFVKGLGNKGILAIESTDPAAQLSEEDLDSLRREFHNFVSRNDNSAAVPIISGPIKLNYIPLAPNPQDMEFLQLEEHIVRALCSAFLVSPQEMGYGHLSVGQGGLAQANKQTELQQGEERGLRMLLDVVYDGLNDILYENFPEARKLYRIIYTGVGDDTKDTIIQRQTAELQTTATMSSLFADSEKTETIPYGGNIPLNPMFHANVIKYMKYGKFMEEFFGEEGWSEKPEYDFIIDPNLNQAYQQLKVTPIKMQKEQQVLALQQQEMQMASMEQQMQQGEQQAQMAEAAQQQPQPQQGQAQEEQQQPQQAPQESSGEQKSLRDEYLERKKLNKSMNYYFSEWMNAHNK